jgi:uncharacterized protein involved in exopolysaccharide biosynthesis|tara:strand:- start:473 stop:1390 length:918 start_codon:yes stop_codon:yes gene_type:complete
MNITLLKKILLKNKNIFVLLLTGTILLTSVITLFLKNEYSSHAYLVAPRDSLSGTPAGAQSSAGSSLAGLLSFAGNASNNDPNIEYAIHVAQSYKFLSKFIVTHDLLPVLLAFKSYDSRTDTISYLKNGNRLKVENLFKDKQIDYQIKEIQDAVKLLRKKFRIYPAIESSIVTASFTFYSPEITKDILSKLLVDINQSIAQTDAQNSERNVTYIAAAINKYPQPVISKTLGSVLESNLTKMVLAQSELDYAFTIVDAPILALKKSWPSRTFIVLSTFLAMILLIIIALFVEFQLKLREESSHQKD